jgi:hypothetical protein
MSFIPHPDKREMSYDNRGRSMKMIRYLLLAVLVGTFCGCSGRDALEPDPAPVPVPVPASDVGPSSDFTLSCEVDGDSLKCSLHNSSTDTIQYSNYTIGYDECLILEHYDADSGSWVEAKWRDSQNRYLKGAGATYSDVKSVTPEALVPPENAVRDLPPYSFTVRLENYVLPEEQAMTLRVTQIMGTCLGEELPVWKGQVVSDGVEYRPSP